MEQLITQIIARVLIVYGLLVSAFVLSNILEIKELADVREYAASIFSTNCFFLVNCHQTCLRISTALIALPIVSSLLVAIFYKAFTMVFTALSLGIFAIFFCNPKIDLSFTSFIHFIQVCVCISGLLYLACSKQNKIKSI